MARAELTMASFVSTLIQQHSFTEPGESLPEAG